MLNKLSFKFDVNLHHLQRHWLQKTIHHVKVWFCIQIWLVVLGFDATLTAKVISWRSVMHMFLGFLTPILAHLFFPKPPTTFLTCFCRSARRKYVGKSSPQQGIELTTTRSRVQRAHHWATLEGLAFKSMRYAVQKYKLTICNVHFWPQVGFDKKIWQSRYQI